MTSLPISRIRSIIGLVLSLVVAGLVAAPPSSAGVANAGLPGASPANPLTGMPFGTFASRTKVPTVDPPSAYLNTARNAEDRVAFARFLGVPRFRWFGANIPVHSTGFRSTYKPGAYQTARNYIRTVQHGDRNTLVPIGIFRLTPFEQGACRRLPTAAEVRSYRAWIKEFARGIRDARARVVLLLQPDMPFALCLPRGSKIDLQLIAESARTFNALPFTSVYIDAGSSDWEKPARMSSMLRQAGIAGVRGFGLNLTHYVSTADEVRYGKAILADLARHGIRGKRFVVSTAMNGRPFRSFQHRRTFLEGTICRSSASRACVTPGQLPTTATGIPEVDAFLWLGRPEYNNRTIRTYDELLQLVRTSPFL